MISNTKSKKGYVLTSALGLSVLMLLVGSASMYMVQMGGQTLHSERQYQIAKYAADTGINNAIETMSLSSPIVCNLSANNVLLQDSKGKYSYKMFSDDNGNNCFVISTGVDASGTAKVVKSAIIPIKSTSGAGLGAMNTGSLSNPNWNGSNEVIGSACGPGLTYSSLGSNTSSINDTNPKILGNPKVMQSTQNLYETTFSSPVTNWDTLKTEMDKVVSSKMTDNGISDACKVSDLNTNCNTNKVKGKLVIECTGGTPKTIDPSACSQVVLSVQSMTINLDIPSTTTMTVNTSNTLDIQKSVSGFLTSDSTLNISLAGNEVLDGIFIGGSGGNNMTLGQNGTPVINGLIFMGNNGSYNVNVGGNTKVLGSLVVDGTINNFARNGGGNASPNFEYNKDKINNWQSKYGLIKQAGCDSGTPPSKKAMIEKTKMSLF